MAASDLWIANTVANLIQGDWREHLPLEPIPLQGDVLGLGTTTSLDNGELTFLQQPGQGDTTIWTYQASDGGIQALQPGDGSAHYPYVCFSGDVTAERTPLDPALPGDAAGRPLKVLVGEAISLLRRQGRLPEAPIYGLRLRARWQSLVITVASRLCMGQQRRNTAIACTAASEPTAARSIHQVLQHDRLAPHDPGGPPDPIRCLCRSLQWECCGFHDSEPQKVRMPVPLPDDHLHHEHSESQQAQLELLVLYPLQRIQSLASDLGVDGLRYHDGAVQFRVANHGGQDVSDVGVAVVIDDRCTSHLNLRLPWLAAAEAEQFSVPLALESGRPRLEVMVDPQQEILERPELQASKRQLLEVEF